MTKKDEELYSRCSVCDELLRTAKQPRTSAKVCASCRGDSQSDDAGLKSLFKELSSRKIQMAEDEMVFEDDPIANKEKDYERYISKPLEFSYGQSELSSMMTDTSHHHFQRNPPKEKNSYRKGKE
jgi:hypothetical protein